MFFPPQHLKCLLMDSSKSCLLPRWEVLGFESQ